MPVALELLFDDASEQRLFRLWEELQNVGVPTVPTQGHRAYRPHISLAGELDDLESLCDAVDDVVLPHAFELTMSSVGMFPDVLWLGPSINNDLLVRNLAVHKAIDKANLQTSPLYQPGRWVPHCTISMAAKPDHLPTALPLCFDILPLQIRIAWAAAVEYDEHSCVYHIIADNR